MAVPCFDVEATVPPGAELVIDGATRTVEVRRLGDGALIGGIDALNIVGPMVWPEMGPCAEVCWSVDPATNGVVLNDDTTVSIEQINREV
jgi:hypothetical protein